MIQFRHIRQFFFVTLIILLSQHLATAQTTAFTYQGKLTDSGNLANGSYDLQFALFDALSGGTQQGTTQTVSNVAVTNGIFTVQLDFGACPTCFNGSARFLEIAVKPSSGGSFTTLSPRQPVTSTPYAINSAQLGGLAASGYLQNSTSQQASSNFNISGNGTAGGTLTGSIVNAVQQVNINGLRVFTVNGAFNNGSFIFTASNTFAGDGAGVNTMPSGTLSDLTGKFNSFYGAGAGQQNTTGQQNAFFGTAAGQNNTTGSGNAYFGPGAGHFNTTGTDNAFFGSAAGFSNTTANNNSFFGAAAGQQNTLGFDNSFFGFEVGFSNTTGANNSFFGSGAGFSNTTGFGNAFFGQGVGQQNTTGSSNAFFGTQAGQQNTTGTANSFFGSVAGNSNTTGQQNAFFGTGAGFLNTTGGGNAFFGYAAGNSNTTANNNAFFGAGAGENNTTGKDNAFFGAGSGGNGSTGDDNSFFGREAGRNNTANGNSFFGRSAGFSNTTGFSNSFFGFQAGISNTTGQINSFFGDHAGSSNTTGGFNSIFGAFAGQLTTTGSNNAYFGTNAGHFNTTEHDNTFIGEGAGFFNGTNDTNNLANFNTFVGSQAGVSNTVGTNNTVIGANANINTGVNNGTAIGANAVVSQSNSLILGSINGINASADTFVGIGTTAPTAKLTVSGSGAFNASSADRFDLINTVFGSGYLQNVTDAGLWQLATTGGMTRLVVDTTGRVGIGTVTPQDALDVSGNIRIGLGVGGDQPMCRGSVSHQVATCSSSLRYKTAVRSFTGGLAIISRLRPITFTWKQGGRRDIGLGAEEVEKVEPLLTFRNDKGEVEGVKYNQLSALFINAFKEQQAQIARQQTQTERLQRQVSEQQELIQQQKKQVEALKRLVCKSNPDEEICKP